MLDSSIDESDKIRRLEERIVYLRKQHELEKKVLLRKQSAPILAYEPVWRHEEHSNVQLPLHVARALGKAWSKPWKRKTMKVLLRLIGIKLNRF